MLNKILFVSIFLLNFSNSYSLENDPIIESLCISFDNIQHRQLFINKVTSIPCDFPFACHAIYNTNNRFVLKCLNSNLVSYSSEQIGRILGAIFGELQIYASGLEYKYRDESSSSNDA